MTPRGEKQNRVIIVACFLLLQCSCFPSFSQEINEVLKAHFVAIKQDNLQSIRSLLMEVKEVHSDGDFQEYSIIKKRPHRIRIEGRWEDSIYVKAFDGIRAWTIAPWTGTSIPQLMTEVEKAEIVSVDRIDSPLFIAWKAGDSIELIGDIPLGGEVFYAIQISKPGRPVMKYLLHKTQYLIHKSLRYDIQNASKLVEEVFYKRYSHEGAIVVPMEYEVRRKGISIDLVVKEMVVGYGAPSSLFKKPE